MTLKNTYWWHKFHFILDYKPHSLKSIHTEYIHTHTHTLIFGLQAHSEDLLNLNGCFLPSSLRMQQNENKWHPLLPSSSPPIFTVRASVQNAHKHSRLCFPVSVWRLSGERISAVWLTVTGFISQSRRRKASWEMMATCPAALSSSSQCPAVQFSPKLKITNNPEGNTMPESSLNKCWSC